MPAVIANHPVPHSMYYGQVQRALEILGRDRVLVLQYERCVDDPLAQMQRTQRFLGLEPLESIPRALERRVPSGLLFPLGDNPPLPARLRLELTSALADDVRQVAAVCPDLDLGLWPSFASL